MSTTDAPIVPPVDFITLPVPDIFLQSRSSCALQNICIPCGLDAGEMRQLDQALFASADSRK